MTATDTENTEINSRATDDTISIDAPASVVCKNVQAGPTILFLVDQVAELGGGERTLFKLARLLPQHGFRVFVVTFRNTLNPAAAELCDDITVFPLKSCFGPEALRVAFQLRKLIRSEQIEIVHTFFETSDIFGALVARFAGVRSIVSSRRDMGILRSKKHSVAYRMMRNTYSAVLAVSEQVRRWHLEADHLREDRVHTIYNGLDLDQYGLPLLSKTGLRCGFGLPEHVPLVTTIANINAWKGIDVFLRSAEIVHRLHPTAVFAVAGEWTDLALVDALRSQAESLRIADRVYFLGRIADVPSLLLATDVFALLSRSEGFPNVVLEAMAAALPVVATAVGGTPEAVDDLVTGYLVANEDAEAAARHISDLLSDSTLRKRMGMTGRRHVEQEFSSEQMVERHIDLYNSLLQSNTQGA